jgi:hypothetical protein
MTLTPAGRLRVVLLALAAVAVLAGCTYSAVMQQHANPQYVGKPFKRVLVVAATYDDLMRRVVEDRMVTLLGQRGISGVPGYTLLAKGQTVDQAALRRVVGESGADGVFLVRVTNVDEGAVKIPGYNVTVGVGTGWGGFYDSYTGYWQTTTYAPSTMDVGPVVAASQARLFDARTGTLAWSATVRTTEQEGSNLGRSLDQYVGAIFNAMVQDGVI